MKNKDKPRQLSDFLWTLPVKSEPRGRGSVFSTASGAVVPSCYVIVFDVACVFRLIRMTHSTEWLPSAWVNYLGNIQGPGSQYEERVLEDEVHFGILCFKMSVEIPERGQTSLHMTKETEI